MTLRNSILTFFFLLLSILLLSCGAAPPIPVYDGVVLNNKTSSSDSLRIIALGDAGSGDPQQQILVAEDLSDRAATATNDFILYLGDNFYENGVSSVTDPLWTSAYTDIYDFNLLPTFYAIAGNHDYYGNVIAEVDYSAINSTWVMPSLSYAFSWTLSGGTRIEFLAIDTTILVDPTAFGVTPAEIEAYWNWIENRLEVASGEKLIVFGHHPVYSAGYHGDSQILIDRLHPLLTHHGVDLYLAGHDHNIEVRQPLDGVNYIISGSGGKLREITAEAESLYAESVPGAVIIDIRSVGFTITPRNSQTSTDENSYIRTWN